ncbi:7TMR-DISMED2 domain-containing protein, partial [Mycobacterium tuberculosis]
SVRAATLLNDASAPLDLYDTVDFLLDPQASLTLDQVRATDAPFTSAHARRDLSFGYVPGVVWLRLNLQSNAQRVLHWRLELS